MSNLTQTQEENPLQLTEKSGADIGQIPAQQSTVFPEQLMPYGEAAKAIFIKANGATSYSRGIRVVRHSED